MDKGDLLSLPALLVAAADHSRWFVHLPAPLVAHRVAVLCRQLRVRCKLHSSRRGCCTVNVSVPLVTHTGVDMRLHGGFVSCLFSRNLGS